MYDRYLNSTNGIRWHPAVAAVMSATGRKAQSMCLWLPSPLHRPRVTPPTWTHFRPSSPTHHPAVTSRLLYMQRPTPRSSGILWCVALSCLFFFVKQSLTDCTWAENLSTNHSIPKMFVLV